MLQYCKGLKFEEDPNYNYLNKLLKDAFISRNFHYDFAFDWVLPRTETSSRAGGQEQSYEPGR
jgi:hypothetical protein